MPDEWYFSHGGTERQGPVMLADLQAKRESGELAATDLVWRAGMPQWVAAASVAELGFAPAQMSPNLSPQLSPTTPPVASPMPVVPLGTVNYSQPHPGDSITCTERTIDLLRETRPWARVMAVMMFIGTGLMVLGGFGIMTAAALGPRNGVPAFLGLAYFAMAGIYIAPAIYLNRYCSRITQVVTHRRDDLLEQAIQAQKSFWKYCGILALLIISLYVLGIVIMIIFFALRH